MSQFSEYELEIIQNINRKVLDKRMSKISFLKYIETLSKTFNFKQEILDSLLPKAKKLIELYNKIEEV